MILIYLKYSYNGQDYFRAERLQPGKIGKFTRCSKYQLYKKKSCRGEHGRRPTFGINELIFTETKIFETKVVPWGMLHTIVYYRFKENNNKNINSTNK